MKRRLLLKTAAKIAGAAAIGGVTTTATSTATTPSLPSPAEPPKRSIPKRHTKDGWAITRIHYDSVPDYDYLSASQGLSEEAKRQELEIDWTASKGKRVYPEFSPKLHRSHEDLAFDVTRPVYCGWDFGGTPAFVLSQLNVFGQWLVFPTLSPLEDTSIGIYDFGKLVSDYIQRNYASPHGLDWKKLRITHYGDPAGAMRPPKVGQRPRECQSAFEILQRGLVLPTGMDEDGESTQERRPGFGIKIRPGAVNLTARLEAVRARLRMTLRDGLPAIVIDHRATCLLDGFGGAYCYPQYADGTYGRDPKKNWYSHTHDALQYVATRLFSAQDLEEEEEAESGWEFRSHAASRYD